MPLEKPVEQIAEADLRYLIANQVSEQKVIEYKVTLPGDSDEEKKEFLADVSSFANAGGGHLIYGMKEDGGLPVELSGVEVNDTDSIVAALDSRIRDGIRRRIPGVVVWPVKLERGRIAIVIRVPKSYASPHMVAFKGSSRFYARNSNGKYQLDVDEIGAAFLLSDRTAERVRDFRLDRIAKIEAGDTPVPLTGAAKVVLHVVPFSALSPSQIELQAVATLSREIELIPLGFCQGWDGRFNLEGYVRYNPSRDERSTQSYLQIWRDGSLESVDTSLPRYLDSDPLLKADALENSVIQALERYFAALPRLGAVPPVAAMLSLLRFKGFKFDLAAGTSFRTSFDGRFDRDVILVPEVVFETFGTDVARTLRQAFDVIWNAAGWSKSMYYDDRGARRKGA